MYWYNGNLIESKTLELPIDDPGLLYGATVFTTLRLYNRSLDSPLTNWKQHCDRLLSSLQSFNWQQPNWNRVRQGAEALLPHFPVLRIVIFADGREWITGRFLPDNLTEKQKYGIEAWLAEESLFCRSIPNHKTGNYLSAWLALQKAQQIGSKEAILIDSSGNWLETSTGNLWGWRDGQWWTPPVEAGILPGIARSQLISWLQSQNQPVGQDPWDASFVQGLEAIAYTNSVVEVVPINTVISQHSTITYDPYHSSLEQLRSIFGTDRQPVTSPFWLPSK
ncbi:MAG TPA: aminotransferase class IV [Candidatus Obscuribacterales bacterium]